MRVKTANLGVHLHSALEGLDFESWLATLKTEDHGAARVDTNWAVMQPEPAITGIDTASLILNDFEYNNYLVNRGYGTNSQVGFDEHADLLSTAFGQGIEVTFNFGVTPQWLLGDTGTSYPTDPGAVGKALFDLIVHTFRMAESQGEDGLAIIKNVAGWQVFNEISNLFGEYGSGENGDYFEYFEIVRQTNELVKTAYEVIGLTNRDDQPPVIAPSNGSLHDPIFFEALYVYEAEYGSLDIQSMTMYPYGPTVQAWASPDTGEYISDELKFYKEAYFRLLQPTEDYLTWKAMTERSQDDNLVLFESYGSVADDYWDKNSESGTERTMAELYQNGMQDIEVNFAEFGASSYRGNSGAEGLWSTSFVDPFKYGAYDDGPLTEGVALNLQLETVIKTVGLIEDWDFVRTATVYEYFDRDSDGSYEGSFGIHDADGAAKPSGEAYFAYLAGEQFSLVDLSGVTDNIGVDIHIAASGESGAFDELARDTAAHELILLREGNDFLDAGSGDDVVFGGSGNDTIYGRSGYDQLYGGSGNDVIIGGSGRDKIKGGSGDDILVGGAGGDQFSFSVYNDSGSGNSGQDTITDFEVGVDKIALTGSYSAAELLDPANGLISTAQGNTRIILGDNGSSITLLDVLPAQLEVTDFRILSADTFGDVTGAEVHDIASENQFLTGSTNNDIFVVDGLSSDYQLNRTQDQTGFVLWNDAGFDVLFDFEAIRFNDTTLELEPQSGTTFIDDPSRTQHLTGTSSQDVFVIDGLSSDYNIAPTEDLNGFVVWNDESFDVLTDFETIRFNDKIVNLGSEPTGRFINDPDENEHLTGTGSQDVFVVGANQSEYRYNNTEDGLGVIVWNDETFDILNGFEEIEFNDISIQLTDGLV